MKVIGITGGVGAGKSFILEHLEENFSVEIVLTDDLAKELMMPGTECNRALQDAFSSYDVFDSDKINREKLGKLVFGNKNLLKNLENIIYPLVKIELENIFKKYKKEKCIFISIPQLFEAGFENLFDKIVFISAKEEIRLERLMQRNNYSKEYAMTRILAQNCEDEKIKKSDFVIYNNSDIDNLKLQINNLLSLLQ